MFHYVRGRESCPCCCVLLRSSGSGLARAVAIAPLKGVNAMTKMISKKDLRSLVVYSLQHIARLEKAGEFPKRVRLGRNRVAWIEQEVMDWLIERINQRESFTASS